MKLTIVVNSTKEILKCLERNIEAQEIAIKESDTNAKINLIGTLSILCKLYVAASNDGTSPS